MTSQPTTGPESSGTCRICLVEDEIWLGEDKPEFNRLISPCLCNGTVKWVHRHCLSRWRLENEGSVGEYVCEICHARYSLRSSSPGILRYIWSQWTPTEKYFYLLELASLLISVTVGATAFLSDAKPGNGRFSKLSSLIPSYPLSHPITLPTSPSLPLVALLLPKPLLRAIRRLFFSVFVFNHYLLYGHSTRSKLGIYFCTILTILSHVILFQRWQAENAIEVLCNRSDLESEKLLNWTLRRIR